MHGIKIVKHEFLKTLEKSLDKNQYCTSRRKDCESSCSGLIYLSHKSSSEWVTHRMVCCVCGYDLTQQRYFVLQEFIVAGGQDAHGAAGSEAALLHEPFARLHQGGRELRRVHAVIPPAPDAIRNTWEENRMGKMSSLKARTHRDEFRARYSPTFNASWLNKGRQCECAHRHEKRNA